MNNNFPPDNYAVPQEEKSLSQQVEDLEVKYAEALDIIHDMSEKLTKYEELWAEYEELKFHTGCFSCSEIQYAVSVAKAAAEQVGISYKCAPYKIANKIAQLKEDLKREKEISDNNNRVYSAALDTVYGALFAAKKEIKELKEKLAEDSPDYPCQCPFCSSLDIYFLWGLNENSYYNCGNCKKNFIAPGVES